MTASDPLEYVCFFPMELPTREGDVYFFMALDVYSEVLMHLGVVKQSNDNTVLERVKLLMENERFKATNTNGFTLVFHKYAHIQEDIEAIIKPYGGKMIIDDPWVAEKITPVMMSIAESLTKQ